MSKSNGPARRVWEEEDGRAKQGDGWRKLTETEAPFRHSQQKYYGSTANACPFFIKFFLGP
jgi:hypothetical protein